MSDYYHFLSKTLNLKHPKIIFFATIALIYCLSMIVTFFTANSYNKELQHYSQTNQHFEKLVAHKDAVDKSGLHYELSKQYLRVDNGFPSRLMTGYFDIPVTSIVGCSQSWWDGSQYDTHLLLKETKKVLDLRGINLKEWCWNNKIPFYSRAEMGAWKDKQTPLPNADSDLVQQRLSSKEAYFAVR